jgi:magnesium-transporting ATPase (P-type)
MGWECADGGWVLETNEPMQRLADAHNGMGVVLHAQGNLQAAAIHSALGTKWQTVVFSFLCFAELGAALALTSETTSFFRMPLGKLKAMLGAVAVTVALQISVIYVPFMNEVYDEAKPTAESPFLPQRLFSPQWNTVLSVPPHSFAFSSSRFWKNSLHLSGSFFPWERNLLGSKSFLSRFPVQDPY